MKKKIIALLFFMLILFTSFGQITVSANADNGDVPLGINNLQHYLIRNTYLIDTGYGYTRVIYDGGKVCIEQYDSSFSFLSRSYISMELPIWGGFYNGSDAYYLIEGANNTAENTAAEVIRVIKYSKSWNRIGAASITGNDNLFGGEVRYPFDVGCVEVAEYQDKLYVVTGHEGYVDSSVGQGHQGMLLITIDKNIMQGSITSADLWHSFAQRLTNDGNKIFLLELSEGSQCTALTEYNADGTQENYAQLLSYGGNRTSAWAVPTYSSVDDVVVSANNVLGIGTSIDQSLYSSVNDSTAHNIYLTVTPKNDISKRASRIIWLTTHRNDGTAFTGLQLVKINDNRFAVLWDEYGERRDLDGMDILSEYVLHYVFIDEYGNKISNEYTAATPLSNCKAIYSNGKIIFCASNAVEVSFVSIDAFSGACTKKSHYVAGEKAEWYIEDGTLKVSGMGAINIDSETYHKMPLSSTKRWFSYSSETPFEKIKDQFDKIDVLDGITEIGAETFAGLDTVVEITLGDTVTTIGAGAFQDGNRSLRVYVPHSVRTIGEDAFWSGYYSYSDEKITYATIVTPCDSFAAKYAEENHTRTELLHDFHGGVCSVCGYEFELEQEYPPYYGGRVIVTSDEGADIWTRPYTEESEKINTVPKDTVLNFLGLYRNSDDEVWYKLEDETWIHKNDVLQQIQIDIRANGWDGPSEYICLEGEEFVIPDEVPHISGYIFRGWASSYYSYYYGTVDYLPGDLFTETSDTTLYALWDECPEHEYTYHWCKTCRGLQTDYSGLACMDGVWVYDWYGEIDTDRIGFVDFEGGKFLVIDGYLDVSAMGLVLDPDYGWDWYFVANGQVQSQYTGLAQYDGAWFYVSEGRLDTYLAAYVEYDGGLFFVGAGRIMTEVNGLAQDPNGTKWYYLADGQAQTQYTGLAQYDDEWFYVVNGVLAEDYTGTVEYDGSSFNVVNGMVREDLLETIAAQSEISETEVIATEDLYDVTDPV